MREQHGPIKEQHAFSGNGHSGNKGKQGKPFFGNYDLVRRIDVGGMGEVYLAQQRTAFGREVAVKIIRSDLVHDVMARKRFLREAEVSAHLKHEHILPLVEFGEEQGRLFLVTPYIDGGTLAQRLQSGPLSLSEVHRLFTALVRAVAYIHKRGVIHRDLKPSNILLDQEEGNDQVYVRLIDFGIASIQGMEASAPLTESGNEMGTIAYMAPERLDGVAAPSNDIYSLGVMLYQMLTGHLPTEGKRLPLSPPMEYVVKHCTALDPNDRFSSADELLKVFEQAYRAVKAPKSAPIPAVTSIEDDAPRRTTTARPIGNVAQESKPRVDTVGTSQVQQNGVFSEEDYNAPTTYIGPAKLVEKTGQLAAVAPVAGALPSKKSRTRRRRKGSIFVGISFTIIAILLIAGLVGYYTFQAAISATVDLSPQVHVITKVLTVTAKPTQHTIDAGSASVPAYVLTSSKTGSQQGNTTGQKCVLGIFDCQQTVAFSDVDALATQLKQSLRVQAEQDLRRQAQANGATTIGGIGYTDSNLTSDPQIGAVSKTVSVTLTEQGSVEYFKTNEVQNLARLLLTQQTQQQFGSSYALLNSSTQVGQPSIQGVDGSGVVTMQIAVGGVAEYQISPTQLENIQSHIKGIKQKDANTFLLKQPGIDPHSVNVHVTYGNTIPSDVHQIKIVPVTPSNIPAVQLPAVKPGVTPTQ